MKILNCLSFLSIFFMSFFANFANAQWQLTNPDLQLKDTQINPDYTDTLTGQKGIFISLNYEYKPAKNKLLSSQIRVKLKQNNQLIYSDSSQIWLFNPKKSQTLDLFIPLVQIRLAAGWYKTELEIDAPQVANLLTTVEFIQTSRYKADILLDVGEIKPQLREYDPKENPRNWLPDPYIGIFLQNASQPIYKTRVFENTYLIDKQQFSFYLPPNAKVEMRVYDEDGEADTLLGRVELPPCVGDADFNYSAAMFGDCKGFFYQLYYQQLILQPINLYAKIYDYQGQKGVLLTSKYDLARTYTTQKSRLNFVFYNEKGEILPTENIIPLPNSPRLDSFIQPLTRGEWQYFLPFHSWRNATYKIALQLNPEIGEPINSTPCVLSQPIVFDNPVRFARIYTQENQSFQQVKGVFIHIEYALNPDLQTYQMLEVAFNTENKNLQIYKIEGEKYQPAEPIFVQNQPAIKAKLQFFVPYAGMKKRELLTIHCGAKTAKTSRPVYIIADTLFNLQAQNSQDVALILKKIDDCVVNGDYGKQFFLQTKVPFFLKNKLQLKITATKNGAVFSQYKPFKLLENGYLISSDEAALLFPYRFWQGRDSLSFSMVAVDMEGNELSPVLSYQYRLPEVVNTVQMRVEINQMRINPKKLPKDSSQRAWATLQFYTGGDMLSQNPLPALVNIPRAELKKQTVSFWAHREDKLAHKIVYNNDTLNLWTADWGKIGQAHYQQIIRKKGIFSRFKVWVLPEKVAQSPFRKFWFKTWHSSTIIFRPKKRKKR